MGEAWKVDSIQTRDAYIEQVKRWWDEHKYVTFPKPRFGVDRSLDQNALFHVFCTEWIAFKLGKHPKMVEKFELAGMKRTVKKMYLIAYPESKSWMIHEIMDYTTGLKKKDYTSSKDWKRGEMYQVLTFMQNESANQGCILESKGEFAKNQREANGQ